MRILIVEDEQKLASALRKGLAAEKFAVDVEHDSDSGLGAALSEPYDVMVIDRMLPGSMEGLDIARKVRQAGKNTPIIFLTAKDQVHERISGLNIGADDYLVKPFDFDELLARIRALLRRPAETKGIVLEVGDLSLNTVTYDVHRAGRAIKLSAKEFALLEYLMRNAGQVITKDSIIAHVWDFDSDILPNTVEVYVGYLRSKIDKPFRGPQLLHTLRGFGYRLGEPKGR